MVLYLTESDVARVLTMDLAIDAVAAAFRKLSLDEAIRLRDEAEAAGKILSVNQNMRYDQSMRVLKQIMDAGALGDIVFAEVPDSGKQLKKGDDAAVVESVKAASDVYAPVSGEVIQGNGAIAEEPALINSDPQGNGWFFTMKLSDPSEADSLMDAESYRQSLS